MTYTAPLDDLMFVLRDCLDTAVMRNDADLATAVLDAAGQLACDVLAPLNRAGDIHGSKLTDAGVSTAPGFADAYAQMRDGGWIGLGAPEAFGGQALPRSLVIAASELFQSANMAFGLCPVLSQGAIEALIAHGTPEQQSTYLPKLVSGHWTGTMNLTEPQAGSDVGAAATRALPADDGTYRLFGQKIFITWGDHDVADNIIHLVLARLPDAPAGAKGLSLFLAPKFRINPDGTLGHRNDLRAVGLEHKLGIHGSPTCVMQFGETDGAWAELIGPPHGGMAAMFTMMNAARLQVGAQGVGIAERALQCARAYAHERKQGKAVWSDTYPSPIYDHPDVRRMVAVSAAKIMAARAICLACADAADRGDHMREDILVPLAKAFGTDVGVEVASTGIQIHGGMGFIEETGAAQHYRDARIAPIYEGTNAIQANDLIGRKLAMHDGAAIISLLADIADEATACTTALPTMSSALSAAHTALTTATQWMRDHKFDADAQAGAVSYATALAEAVGGMYLARGARRSGDTRRATQATVYAQHVLALTPARAHMACVGADALRNFE